MEEKNSVTKKFQELLDEMSRNPEKVTPSDENFLKAIFFKLCKALKFSEHSAWKVEYQVSKWNSLKEKMQGVAPYEVVNAGQNIILNDGANEMLKVICGTGGSPYNAANAKIYVGTDSTPENASQTGVLASGGNKAYANMDSGYPIVSGRTATFQATFSESAANFAWNEASITNGTGVGNKAMNRKVATMGTKVNGAWTIQITVSLVSA